jgi:ornithine cyclodeaminase
MHILSEPDVAHIFRSLTKEQCETFISTLSNALISITRESSPSASSSTKQIHQPLRTVFTTSANNTCIFMPVSDTATTGIKVVTVSETGIKGVINVFNPEGRLQGLLAAAEVTAFRTALATMTLFVRCTTIRKDHVVVFGCGRQAEWHARLALLLYPEQIRCVTFLNRGRGRLEEFEGDVVAGLRRIYPAVSFETLAKEGNEDGYEAKLGEVLGTADVIFSCTPAVQPNFGWEVLEAKPKQRFISLIGSYKPHMREVDTRTLLSGGKVYVDSKVACLEEAGELIEAKVSEEQLIEMGDLLGAKTGVLEDTIDVPAGCNVVYKCVGMGLMDLVVGKQVLDVGAEMELGTHVSGF